VDLNGGTIRDNAGNAAVLTFTPPDTSGVLVDAGDTVAPTIGSVTPPANGTYRAGQVLDVLVRFSEPVNVGTSGSAKPYLRLRIASAIRNATFSVGAVGASPGLAPTRCPIQRNNKGESGTRPYKTYKTTEQRNWLWRWCVAQGV